MNTSYQWRAYSRGIKGGGFSIQSSTEAGGIHVTSEAGGMQDDVTKYRQEGAYPSSSDIGLNDNYESEINMQSAGSHNHGISPGTGLMTADGGTVYFVQSGEHYHKLMSHYHNIAFITHDHEFKIREHTHSVRTPNHHHDVTIQDHTHDLEHGIFQGPMADSVTIKVDGVEIPQIQIGEDIDIIPYLSTDSSGKVLRNTWHKIEIKPNNLTRVIANVFMQVFTNSRGGGDF